MAEQRNPYMGKSPRAWVELHLKKSDEVQKSATLIVDTGSPMGLILAPEIFDEFVLEVIASAHSNFGELLGGFFKILMLDTGITELVHGYRSEAVGKMVKKSHPNFVGLVGLPFLRLGEYGGDPSSFYFRYPPHSHFTQEDHEQPQA